MCRAEENQHFTVRMVLNSLWRQGGIFDYSKKQIVVLFVEKQDYVYDRRY